MRTSPRVPRVSFPKSGELAACSARVNQLRLVHILLHNLTPTNRRNHLGRKCSTTWNVVLPLYIPPPWRLLQKLSGRFLRDAFEHESRRFSVDAEMLHRCLLGRRRWYIGEFDADLHVVDPFAL